MNLEKSSMNTFQKNETNNISLINQLNEDVLLISSQLNEISSVNKCSESVILEKQHSKNQLSQYLNKLQKKEKVFFLNKTNRK